LHHIALGETGLEGLGRSEGRVLLRLDLGGGCAAATPTLGGLCHGTWSGDHGSGSFRRPTRTPLGCGAGSRSGSINITSEVAE
jgi:hypothetical protein